MRPPAFIQVDVDGLWTVRACYDKPERGTFEDDPCWTEGVAGFLDLFRELDFAGSFFVVGRDLEVPAKRALAARMIEAGHEIANHSYTHTIGLSTMGPQAIRAELQRTQDAFVAAGLPPAVGFRSPGYDVDEGVLEAVREVGLRYDASLLPSAAPPLLRLADAWLARKWRPGRRQFGRAGYARAPRVPYWPSREDLRRPTQNHGRDARATESAGATLKDTLLELPVTTLPPLCLPLTGSAIFALGPERVVRALERHRAAARPVLIVLHAIDLTDCSAPIVFDTRRPRTGGFDRSAEEKRALIEPVLRWIAENFRVVRARDWVADQDVSQGRAAGASRS